MKYRFSGFFLVLASVVLVMSVAIPVWNESSTNDLYSYQAEAFLGGQLCPAHWAVDTVPLSGRYCVPHPPLPTLLVLPGVALFGVSKYNTLLIGLLLFFFSGLLMFRLLLHFKVTREQAGWLVVGFLFGTGLWPGLTMLPGVWHFAHLVATFCVLSAFHATFVSPRAWLAGLAIGGAACSRQLLIFSALPLAVAWWRHTPAAPGARVKVALAFTGGTLIPLAGFLVFNHLRYGNPFEMGHRLMQHEPTTLLRIHEYGVLSFRYWWSNFYYLFIQGFGASFDGENGLGVLRVNPFGTSLTVASPFLILAFFAKDGPLALGSAWLAIGLAIFVELSFVGNGWVQINCQRYALDFVPLLVLLAGLGARRAPAWVLKTTVGYAVFLNVFALWVIPVMNHLLQGDSWTRF